MVPRAFVRQYAVGQEIEEAVADQEIVLHYALALMNERGLVGISPVDQKPGPLLFKGGTALRKCVFGSTGRFSQDIDLDATEASELEAEIEAAFSDHNPYHGISFAIPSFRYSDEGNFSGTVSYQHADASGRFELQISYRMQPVLNSRPLTLIEQSYFSHLEPPAPVLYGLDPYEMIGEKIMACSRRFGGSSKDVYDLYLWAQRPFDEGLVRRLAVLKAWTDRRAKPRYDPEAFLKQIVPSNFRWTDISRLVPRKLEAHRQEICDRVQQRFSFLARCTENELGLLADQTAHQNRRLFDSLRNEAREWAASVFR